MKQYNQLVEEVLSKGTTVDTRSGKVISSLNHTMTFNLKDGFPLLTTKHVSFHNVLTELLWFLRGDTNVNWLHMHGVHIWDLWADEYGDLGNIYGAQWRAREISTPSYDLIDSIVEDWIHDKDSPRKPDTTERRSSLALPSPNPKILKLYGELTDNPRKVDPSWRDDPMQFFLDISTIPGYNSYLLSDDYDLFHGYYGMDLKYSKQSAMFLRKDFIKQIHYKNDSGDFFIKRPICYKDQISDIVETLKTNPTSRRIVLDSYNPVDMGECQVKRRAALDACHAFTVFSVRDGSLHAHMTQRSCDIAIGAPYNIASYSLLIHMLAKLTGLTPGVLHISIVDAHIYHDHIVKLGGQLARVPYGPPKLEINGDVETIDDFTHDNFMLEDYNCHPSIDYKVFR